MISLAALLFCSCAAKGGGGTRVPAQSETQAPERPATEPAIAEPETDETPAPATQEDTETDDVLQSYDGGEAASPDAEETEAQPETEAPRSDGYSVGGDTAIDAFLGCTTDVVSFLEAHLDEYLGTPYQGLFRNIDQPWVLMRYKGGYDDPHMNCAGFLSSVFDRCDGDITLIPTKNGAYANAYNWKTAVDRNGLLHYTFYSIDAALDSGILRKGDLIYINPVSFETGDCHIGFFWGDSPSDNKFLNALLRNDYTRERGYDRSGTMITPIIAESDYNFLYVIPLG